MEKKSKFYYVGGITPQRVTSGWVNLRGLPPGQHKNFATVPGISCKRNLVYILSIAKPKQTRWQLQAITNDFPLKLSGGPNIY